MPPVPQLVPLAGGGPALPSWLASGPARQVWLAVQLKISQAGGAPQSVLGVEQTKVQVAVQPSALVPLSAPSSHCSPGSTVPLPQAAALQTPAWQEPPVQ